MHSNDFMKTLKPKPQADPTKQKHSNYNHKRLKTFSEIKKCLKPSKSQCSTKNIKITVEPKRSVALRKSRNSRMESVKAIKTPKKFFRCFSKDINPFLLEVTMYEEFFNKPYKNSVESESESNRQISESYEFVEMNNQSIHVSKVFRSQISNSFKTSSNKEDLNIMPKKFIQMGEEKENSKNEEQRILNMVLRLKKSVQFSNIDNYKKKLLTNLIKDFEGILDDGESFKTKHQSQQSFGKHLYKRDEPLSVKVFNKI